MYKSLFLTLLMINLSFGENILKVIKVPGNVLGISPTSKAWISADFVELDLYPYFLSPSNDRELNILNQDLKPKKILIKVLRDEANIAFLLKWQDKSKNPKSRDDIREFFDAFSILFCKKQ